LQAKTNLKIDQKTKEGINMANNVWKLEKIITEGGEERQ
jgi:hypothetical protein